MSIFIIVHKRLPLADFSALLLQFFKEKATKNSTSNESIEIRVVSRQGSDRDQLDDSSTEGGDDAGDAGQTTIRVGVDGRA